MPQMVQLAQVGKLAPAYNIVILSFVTFGATDSGGLALTVRHSDKFQIQILNKSVASLVTATTGDDPDTMLLDLKQDILTFKKGGPDQWGRTRKVLVSIGGEQGQTDPAFVPSWQKEAADWNLMPEGSAANDAADNLAYLITLLGADGVDLKITGAQGLGDASTILKTLQKNHPEWTYTFAPLVVTRDQLDVIDGGDWSAVQTVALQCTEEPSKSVFTAIAPGVWDGWADSPPTAWYDTTNFPGFTNKELAVCPGVWGALYLQNWYAPAPGATVPPARWGLIFPTAEQIVDPYFAPEGRGWASCTNCGWPAYDCRTTQCYGTLMTIYSALLTYANKPSASGQLAPPVPSYLCGLSIEWDASDPCGQCGPKANWAFANAAKAILDIGTWAPSGPSYTVSGSTSNVFNGKYVKFSPASGQKLPPLPAWAQDAYVLQGATGGPTATPLLYAKGSGGPHWILGEVDLTTGTLNLVSATNPIVWSFCATQCSTPPHAGWQGVAGAVAVTVTPNT